jgi:hypothetical protein
MWTENRCGRNGGAGLAFSVGRRDVGRAKGEGMEKNRRDEERGGVEADGVGRDRAGGMLSLQMRRTGRMHKPHATASNGRIPRGKKQERFVVADDLLPPGGGGQNAECSRWVAFCNLFHVPFILDPIASSFHLLMRRVASCTNVVPGVAPEGRFQCIIGPRSRRGMASRLNQVQQMRHQTKGGRP